MVKDFHELNYTGENFFFLVSSRMGHEEIARPIEKHFGKMKNKVEIKD
jgi:predicted Zn-dependent peptidase